MRGVGAPSTPLPVAYRMTDVLAFYVLTLRGTRAPHTTLLAGLQDVHDRCVYRVEELLQVSARRLREAPPAYPSSLSLTPMVSDMVALLEDILQASSSSLLGSPSRRRRAASLSSASTAAARALACALALFCPSRLGSA